MNNSVAIANAFAGSVQRAVQDVIVIGGGPAGLATATALARQLYTTIVFDSGVYRNARTKHMHNVVGWDHRDPADYRAKARQDLLARYETVRFEDVAIDTARKTNDGNFELVDEKGRTWTARRMVLAVGVCDRYPDIPGFADLWAVGIFHCLFCDGYEARGAASAGVLAIDSLTDTKMAVHQAYMALRLAERVVIYTHGNSDRALEIGQSLKPGFEITVESRRIERLSKGAHTESDVIVSLAGGEEVSQGFLVSNPQTQVNGPFAKQLGVETMSTGDIRTNAPFGETNVPGLFAAGDCATPIKGVSQAALMGAMAGGGASSQLSSTPRAPTL